MMKVKTATAYISIFIYRYRDQRLSVLPMKPHILKCYFVRKCCSIIKSPFPVTHTATTTLFTTFSSPFEPKGLCCSKIRRGLMAARAPVVNEGLLVVLAVRYS